MKRSLHLMAILLLLIVFKSQINCDDTAQTNAVQDFPPLLPAISLEKSQDDIMRLGKRSAGGHNLIHFGKRAEEADEEGAPSRLPAHHSFLSFGKRSSEPQGPLPDLLKYLQKNRDNAYKRGHTIMRFGKRAGGGSGENHNFIRFGRGDSDDDDDDDDNDEEKRGGGDGHAMLYFGKRGDGSEGHSMLYFGKRAPNGHAMMSFGKRAPNGHAMMSFGKRAPNGHAMMSFGKRVPNGHTMMSFGKRAPNGHAMMSFGKRAPNGHTMMSFGKRTPNGHTMMSFGKREPNGHSMMSFGKREPIDDTLAAPSMIHFGTDEDDLEDQEKRAHAMIHFGKREDDDEDVEKRGGEGSHAMIHFGKRDPNSVDDVSPLFWFPEQSVEKRQHNLLRFGKKTEGYRKGSHNMIHFGKREDPESRNKNAHAMIHFGKRSVDEAASDPATKEGSDVSQAGGDAAKALIRMKRDIGPAINEQDEMEDDEVYYPPEDIFSPFEEVQDVYSDYNYPVKKDTSKNVFLRFG